MKLHVKIDKSGLEKLATLNGQMGNVLERSVKRILAAAAGEVRESLEKGEYIKTRSHILAGSWVPRNSKRTEYEVKKTARGASGSLGSNVAYARVQQKGGAVVPVSRKWLTIPTDAAKTKAGVTRKTAAEYSDLTFIQLRPDLAMLVQKRKARGRGAAKPKVMFWLKKRVQIPASGYLSQPLARFDRSGMPGRIVDATVQEAIDKIEASSAPGTGG